MPGKYRPWLNNDIDVSDSDNVVYQKWNSVTGITTTAQTVCGIHFYEMVAELKTEKQPFTHVEVLAIKGVFPCYVCKYLENNKEE